MKLHFKLRRKSNRSKRRKEIKSALVNRNAKQYINYYSSTDNSKCFGCAGKIAGIKNIC